MVHRKLQCFHQTIIYKYGLIMLNIAIKSLLFSYQFCKIVKLIRLSVGISAVKVRKNIFSSQLVVSSPLSNIFLKCIQAILISFFTFYFKPKVSFILWWELLWVETTAKVRNRVNWSTFADALLCGSYLLTCAAVIRLAHV